MTSRAAHDPPHPHYRCVEPVLPLGPAAAGLEGRGRPPSAGFSSVFNGKNHSCLRGGRCPWLRLLVSNASHPETGGVTVSFELLPLTFTGHSRIVSYN